MSSNHTKVIGYFAYSGTDVVCSEGVACAIAGSQNVMELYLSELGFNGFTIKKTRFGEIVKGISLGGIYSFDEESYGRFYPLAIAEGLSVADPSVFQQKPPGARFLTVRVVRAIQINH